MEVAPEVLDEFPGPRVAGICVGSFAITVVGFLVIEDGLSDASAEEMVPTNCVLLAPGGAVHGVVTREPFRYGGLAEPLDETLGYEFADGLGCIACVVEIVEGDAEEERSLGGPGGMGASE